MKLDKGSSSAATTLRDRNAAVDRKLVGFEGRGIARRSPAGTWSPSLGGIIPARSGREGVQREGGRDATQPSDSVLLAAAKRRTFPFDVKTTGGRFPREVHMIQCKFIYRGPDGNSDSFDCVCLVHSVPRVGDVINFVGEDGHSAQRVVLEVEHYISRTAGTHEIFVYHGGRE